MTRVNVSPVCGTDGRGQDCHAGVVRVDALLQDITCDVFFGHRQIGDASLHGNVHQDRDVAETGVEVYEADRLFGLLNEGGGKVRGDRRLSDATLRAEYGDHGASGYDVVGLSGNAGSPALFLCSDCVYGADELFFFEWAIEIVLHSGQYGFTHSAVVAHARVADDRGVRQQVRQRLHRLQSADLRLFDGDDEDVGLRLLSDGDGFDSVACVAEDRESRKDEHLLDLVPSNRIGTYD